MSNYLHGTALLAGYSNPLLGADASTSRWTKDASAQRYEALKRLPVSELKVRADRAIASLRSWQTSVLADDNARAYRTALDQALWQKKNGDNEATDDDKRLAYARCVHMAEDALLQFTAIGPGDSYWDTNLESVKKGAEATRDALRAAARAPGTFFQWLTGLPSWAMWIGGAAVAGGVLYGGFQILRAATPAVSAELVKKLVPG